MLAILAYHKIGEPPPGGWQTWFYVPETVFADHLAYLCEAGWEVVDTPTLLRGLDDPLSLPRRAAMITFDDGYRSNLHIALPCLLRFGYPAVMFVPTDFIGGHNAFDEGIEPHEPICGWDELRELERNGVSIQSHGVSHRAFSDLTPAAQEQELSRSKDVLEATLGKPVEIFSFPYGDGGDTSAGLCPALRRYRAACLFPGGLVRWPVSDRYRLARVPIGRDTDLIAALGGIR
jgi:peptidoglycan/xylan/chitin deacetylase (PgdA/CDA1 family)